MHVKFVLIFKLDKLRARQFYELGRVFKRLFEYPLDEIAHHATTAKFLILFFL